MDGYGDTCSDEELKRAKEDYKNKTGRNGSRLLR